MAGSKGVVFAAMIANGAIAIMKFIGYLLTGSPSMLAETYHSISDSGNQVLLLIGIKYSSQDYSSTHPFGYGKAQFFYAFLVSVLLFGVAGWESLKHGIHELRAGGHGKESDVVEFLFISFEAPEWVDPFWLSVVILLAAIVFETWAFYKARAELKRQMNKYGWSGYRQAFRRTSDLPTLTAFIEDTVALLGLVVALVGIVLARVLDNPVYDSVGAVIIGVLLMLFAVALAIENKRLIVGESLPDEVEVDLRGILNSHENVTDIDDFRTMFVGSGRVLVTADVSFGAELTTGDIDETLQQLEDGLKDRDDRVKIVYIEPEV